MFSRYTSPVCRSPPCRPDSVSGVPYPSWGPSVRPGPGAGKLFLGESLGECGRTYRVRGGWTGRWEVSQCTPVRRSSYLERSGDPGTRVGFRGVRVVQEGGRDVPDRVAWGSTVPGSGGGSPRVESLGSTDGKSKSTRSNPSTWGHTGVLLLQPGRGVGRVETWEEVGIRSRGGRGVTSTRSECSEGGVVSSPMHRGSLTRSRRPRRPVVSPDD